VDLEDYNNIYRNTVNMTSRGDGVFGSVYHIEHHLHPGMRWHDLGETALRRERFHVEQESVQFWMQGWYGFSFVQAIWLRRYDILASWCLRAGDYSRPADELEELIKRRLRPLIEIRHSTTYRLFDDWLGRQVAAHFIGNTPASPNDDEQMAMRREIKHRQKMLGQL
jgi:hypothetical protein